MDPSCNPPDEKWPHTTSVTTCIYTCSIHCPQQEVWSAVQFPAKPLSQEAEEGSKDDEMARYLQKAAHKASLVAAATARGHMKKMRIVQVTGCTKLLKCSILIQTHTRNRWVSAIEFGQIHKVWETTLGWGMLGGDNSNWGPFCYNYTCFHKLVAVWCQMFLNMLYHMFDIQRADDLSLWFYHWSKLERRFQSSTLKMTNHFCLNW